MARKKEAEGLLSPEITHQIQSLLKVYHQIASNLHNSTDQSQVEQALTDIYKLPEQAQVALLKALAKENEVDAADIFAALNALSPLKEVRKEARRSLIRLEGSKIYPGWTPPIAHAPAIQVNIANPPRFWRGFVTQSREEGELQLILCWEQGYDYSEVRTFTFLLDYWQEGVKDTIADVNSKRRTEEQISNLRHRLTETTLIDCTLAEGKRLLEDALSVNRWRKTEPHKDYRAHLPTINSLILEASDIGEDRGLTFINPELQDQEVAINFLGAWSMGDYGLTYDLLSHDNNLSHEQPREEWIELHRSWADEAHPANLQLGFVRERERTQSALWLPTSSVSGISPRKEVEIGWSLELAETPLSGTLQEMPLGTAVNKETGRHWFWTSYTLVREQDVWRIQRINDEGVNIQSLPIAELQKRIQEYREAIDKLVQQREANLQTMMEELSWRITQLLHFHDALIAKLPLDRQVYEDAYSSAVLAGNPERTACYLERLAQRFPENRGNVLRRLGSTLAGLAYNFDTPETNKRQEHLLKRAEEVLHESIEAQDIPLGHILLAELLISQNRNDEAEAEFQRAKAMQPTTEDEGAIEAGLGNVAMRRERMDEAIQHYRRVAELDAGYPGIWFNLGFAHRLLGHFEEAEANYQRAVQVEPNDIRSYSELTAIYMNQQDKQKARAIMEQGVQANPSSAHLHALLASVLFEQGDQRGAQRQIERAESLDPNLEIVQSVRQYMNASKKR
ncbi:tetratricopeptide repeat protein [Ktedonosporobacter rubrisoli]|uniref:Tetratricopeptide repeat protein n=1 Tax=Ktedonosporobacter rubrisoli TaxID=2509675 RepID=A0A4P6K1Z8_KTERU|nr:tetratricopeptide repeat protein [Ktedonosporobacter rubrisoli]QBD81863.1 tetratricopeptide repeat protein [Ktedonosporobacter rubrisoli]